MTNYPFPGFSWAISRTEVLHFSLGLHPLGFRKPMRSLIVEDARVSQMILEKILGAYGDCHIAKNGIEALQAFNEAIVEKRPFDLICLDMGLPDFGGVEILTKIRAVEDVRGIPTGKKVRVIAVTATSDIDMVKAVTEKGDGYILKPITRERLVQNLVRLGLIPPDPQPDSAQPAP
jgi:two-component system, chemotaxis family, chemotaxis protein CheY